MPRHPLSRPSLLWHLLGSKLIATAVMVSAMLLLVVWVLPFIFYGLPGEQIRAIIYDEPFFPFVGLSLVISTLACVLPRSARIVRRVSFSPDPASSPRIRSSALRMAGPYNADRAVSLLRHEGCKRVVTGDGWAWGVKRPWSPVGTLAFHLATVVFALGIAAGAAVPAEFQGRLVLTEGECLSVGPEDYLEVSGRGAAPQFEANLLSLEPRFHEDVLLFTRLEGRLQLQGGSDRAVAVGRPAYLDPITTVAIEDFGWSLEVQGIASEGVESTSVFDLKAFPSGTPDEIEFGPGEDLYRMRVQVYGDYVDDDGTPASRSFNAYNPAVLVSVWRVTSNGDEKLLIDERIIHIGESFEVLGDKISFTALYNHGVFRVTREPAVPLILLGLLIALVGTSMRLLLPRHDYVIAEEESGEVACDVRVDVYRDDIRALERVRAFWEGRD